MKTKLLTLAFFLLNLSFLFSKEEVPQSKVNEWIASSFGFEPNIGQVQDFEGKAVADVIGKINLRGFSLFLTEKGASFVMYQTEKMTSTNSFEKKFNANESEQSILHYSRFDIELINGNIRKEKIIYEEELPGYTNYYLPSCPDGILFVKSYKTMRLRDVYPGVDWVFRVGDDGILHHEFVVQPDADLSKIKMKVKWADVELEGDRLTYRNPLGVITDGEIFAYEMVGKNTVDVSYKLEGEDVISFRVKGYTGKSPLVIDPPLSLLWGTYYGGRGYERGYSIATDRSGNVFVTGLTGTNFNVSLDFPTYNPGGGAYFQGSYGGEYSDAIIIKFNNSGVRQWATYYGGNGEDVGNSITADENGNIFVTGWTWSSNFPTYNPGGGAYFQESYGGGVDAFILKFNNSGVRLWATCYGGNGEDEGNSITADENGNIFITGWTGSSNFPTYNPGGGAYYQVGGYGAFILKFNNSGVRLWATCYGGDVGYSITTDESGNIFVTGETGSTNFPTLNPGGGAYFQGSNAGYWDAFILKFNNSGVRLWATYYGGSDEDIGYSISTDGSGKIFVTGKTLSTDFPTFNPGGGAYFQEGYAGGGDVFILKFNNSGVRLWATYYGGSDFEGHWPFPTAITSDGSGNVFVTGETDSEDFPTYDPGGGAYFQGSNAGDRDAFILKFTNTGVRQWATYCGGRDYDWGHSIISDGIGNIFVTGYTQSTDFPTYHPGADSYFQSSLAGYYDAFILKFEGGQPTSVQEENTIPSSFVLHQNYPNPFNPGTTIKFDIPERTYVKLTIFDALGREVATLVDGELNPGEHSVVFDATDLPIGVYFYRLQSGKFVDERKMFLIK